MTVDVFERERPRLFGVAYRMLGSVAEAEDVMQEAFVRWQGAAAAAIETPGAFLTTVVTRLCLDQLKSGRARRESYPGVWLPEPLPTDDPVEPMELDESLRLAFLVLLESLTPTERAVFLLHDVFEYEHADIAGIVQRSEAACRQSLHRAREALAARRPRFAVDDARRIELMQRFVSASALGDVDGLRSLLARDAQLWPDGGGQRGAARRMIAGPDRIARFMTGVVRRATTGVARVEMRSANGEPALWIQLEGGLVSMLLMVDVNADGEIAAVRMITAPDKLRRFLAS